MSIFYAYVEHVGHGYAWRAILAFASRSVADEWWRVVSTDSQLPGIKRITPQFYTTDDIETLRAAVRRFLGRLFLTRPGNISPLEESDVPLIPSQPITDYISGNTFYIRCKIDPSKFWYLHPEHKNVLLSREDRTLFRVSAVSPTDGRTTVLIDSDEVKIACPDAAPHIYLKQNNDRLSFSTEKNDEVTVKFGSFKKTFKAAGMELIRMADGSGEEWELV
ncbi:hypothetical protein FA95DRAFT_1555387 [Auriscalpium vulgare]|uniref:Uncharacterized protein n=1 Tax=Auriscalpium vulgare TaxID=40419 RepID=A0ACB8S306_9AGAM|nr:hypothetical protein FA95DRAFT_1555387 [Auriscalpium vulgare]